MPRLALGLEFCGSQYRGWQTQQEGVRSVQETVEKALSKIANHAVTLHAAGRTDAGVHACNMIAHFDTEADRSIRGWIRGTNTVLPHDIAVRWLQPMTTDFHARFKAHARRYRYVIYNHPYRPALLNGQVTHHYTPLDLERMQLAAQKLIGTHNFTSFRAVACQSNQPVRHVSHLTLTRHGQLIVLDIQANGFLHHMVRNIVGALLEIGEGLKPTEWIDHLLIVQDRKEAGVTAPPDGLYFINAYYPEEFSLPDLPLGPVWLNID